MSKISELSDGGSLVSSDYLIAVRSGGNVKVRMDQINVDQIDLGDNEFIRLGNSQDLTIVHAATQSIINQAGIGDLLIQKAGSTKLTVNSSGIDVTGTVTADGLTVSGSGAVGSFDRTDANAIIELKRSGSLQGYIGASTSGDVILYNASAAQKFRAADNGDISFYEDTGTTAKLFWDASAESLGIGTSSAAAKIHIQNDSDTDYTAANFCTAPSAIISNTTSGALNYASLLFSTEANGEFSIGSVQNSGNTASDFVFASRASGTRTERLRIDGTTGNVGIGTASPAIGGGRTYALALTIDGGVSGSLEDTGGLEIGGSTSVNDRLVGSISYFNRDNSNAGATTRQQVAIIEARSVTSDSNAGDDSGGNLTFGTKSEGGSIAERMRIDASGNVAIGGDINGNGVLTLNTPTDSSPQIVFSENNTGKWLIGHRHDGDHFRFYDLANSAERMRLDSSGNLLVGTTDSTPYDNSANSTADNGIVAGAGLFAAARYQGSVGLFNRTGNDGEILGFKRSGAAVGSIGTLNANRIYFGGADTGIMIASDLDCIYPTNGGDTARDNAVHLGNSGTRFKDLHLSGIANIGGTAKFASWSNSGASNGIEIRSTDAQILNSHTGTSAHVYQYFYNANGIVGSISASGSSTAYNTSSDYRLKENVVAMSGATERLKQLKPSRFNFIADADTTVDGFLAHEVQDIVPEAITGTKDAVDEDGNPEYQGIDQSKLVPLLVATIQELEARIAALES